MSEPIQIIKTPTIADLIALVPLVSGLEMRNSIGILPFWDKRTPRAYRIALPADRSPETARQIATFALATLARLEGCDGVAVVVYTDENYLVAECGLHDFIDTLLDRFHDAGYRIKEAALVAGDGWRGHFEDGPEHDLAEIGDAAARLSEFPRDPAPEELPPRVDALTELVDAALVERLDLDRECDAFGILRKRELPDPVEHLERLLDAEPDAVRAHDLAQLLALTQTEGAVDRTVLQIAFGPEAARQSWKTTLAVRERAQREGCTPHELLVRSPGRFHRARDQRLAEMLVGSTDASPSPERLRRAAHLLGTAIANCSLPERSWLMCALGWVRWAMGLNSAADEILRSGARIDPVNTLIPVYMTLIAHCQPAWIFAVRPPARNRRERRARPTAHAR